MYDSGLTGGLLFHEGLRWNGEPRILLVRSDGSQLDEDFFDLRDRQCEGVGSPLGFAGVDWPYAAETGSVVLVAGLVVSNGVLEFLGGLESKSRVIVGEQEGYCHMTVRGSDFHGLNRHADVAELEDLLLGFVVLGGEGGDEADERAEQNGVTHGVDS